MVLLRQSENEQGLAHIRQSGVDRLAFRTAKAKLFPVVVTRQRVGTFRLNRYPSPAGRIGLPQGYPPRFLCPMWSVPRGPEGAVQGATRKKTFEIRAGWRNLSGIIRNPIRGTRACINSQPVSRRSWRLCLSPDVATPRLNRRLLVEGPGRSPHWRWMETSPQASSSAPRPMLPIARNTPRAADFQRVRSRAAQAHHEMSTVRGALPRAVVVLPRPNV